MDGFLWLLKCQFFAEIIEFECQFEISYGQIQKSPVNVYLGECCC